MKLHIRPLTLSQANELVAIWHRHHKKVVGHRFSIGVYDELGVCHGAAIVGRPVARMTEQYSTAEVTRLVTDGTPNACSCLYSACARTAQSMGFLRIQTFILESEPGTSLKATGWTMGHTTSGGDGWQSREGRRKDQPTDPKVLWSRNLNVWPS